MSVCGESVSWSDPHNLSLIVIECTHIMRIISIDRRMIAKILIRILVYKDFVVSHSASLEDKQRI